MIFSDISTALGEKNHINQELISQTSLYSSPDWTLEQIACAGAPMIKQIVVSNIKNDAKTKQNPAALETHFEKPSTDKSTY